MQTEYTIVNVTPASIGTLDAKSITIARTPTGSGFLVETESENINHWFYVDSVKVIQILFAVDTGFVSGLPIFISRPYWAEAVQCASIGLNCD